MVNIDKIIRFENGGMELSEVIELIQEMIDDGSVWEMQGSYGRLAARLIQNGHCVMPEGVKNNEIRI